VRHDGAVTDSPDRRVITGWRAFARSFWFGVVTLGAITVGVASLVRGAPWTVAAAYGVLAAGSAFLAVKMFPKRQVITPAPTTKPAKRSGNPAVRARAKRPDNRDEKSEGHG
jgi:hypothetical protein